MNREALFCDGTDAYVSPAEPEAGKEIQLWFRTAKDDVEEVYVQYRTGAEGGYGQSPLRKIISKGGFDFYSVSCTLPETILRYRFMVKAGEEILYYNKWGAHDKEPLEYYDFRITPGFSVPDWARGAVMYQIYVDRFCNGDPSNDVETGEYCYIGEKSARVTDWYRYPQPMDVRDFYGGDLQGIINKLDYLQNLGVEVIYCNPLFVSPSNHKYDTQDYDYVDPHFGRIVVDGGEVLPDGVKDNKEATKYRIRTTDKRNLEASNELFIKLVEEIHRRGMKIILDGVFNHCGSFNKWLDRELIYEYADGYERGAYVDPDSHYHSYFHFNRDGRDQWPFNGSYDGWWGHDTLPKLNYEDARELEEYVLDVAQKWVSPPYNADGWRLDVAADLGRSNEYNHEFWKKFRKAVKTANPHALILAEHYGDPSDWLQGDEWDSVMNYDAFMEPVTWFLTGMEKHSDDFREDLLGNADNFVNSMKHHMSHMMAPSLFTAMNQLSNHDHSRFLTRTNHVVGRVAEKGPEAANTGVNKAVMRAAIVMQMTWVGAPTLYYGDEAGLCGFTDPDNRRTYPWGREDQSMISFYREMIKIHRRSPALRRGSIIHLLSEKELLAYARFRGDEQIVIVVNCGASHREVAVPVWMAEVPEGSSMARVIYSYDGGYIGEFEEYYVQEGSIHLNMGPFSAIVLKNKKW